MPVDTEKSGVKIGKFNWCLHYAIIKLKSNLFPITASVSQVLVFLLAILLQWILNDNTAACFLTSSVFILSPVVSEFKLHTVCLCFEFRHLTTQFLFFYNIIDLVIVPSVGYFMHLLLLLIQHGDIESNLRLKSKQVSNLSCCYWSVNS